jgi:hypothetical protein
VSAPWFVRQGDLAYLEVTAAHVQAHGGFVDGRAEAPGTRIGIALMRDERGGWVATDSARAELPPSLTRVAEAVAWRLTAGGGE